MFELTLNGITYYVEEGCIMDIPDPTQMFGQFIKICTDEFDVECTNVGFSNGISKFKVEKIIERTSPIFEPAKPLKEMLKSELIEYANLIGVEVNTRMTKAMIIEAIENK